MPPTAIRGSAIRLDAVALEANLAWTFLIRQLAYSPYQGGPPPRILPRLPTPNSLSALRNSRPFGSRSTVPRWGAGPTNSSGVESSSCRVLKTGPLLWFD